MKIAFYEPQCKGIEHLKFLILTISKIQHIYPDSTFYLFGEQELCKNLNKSIIFDGLFTIYQFEESKSRIKNLIEGIKVEKHNLSEIKKMQFDKVICTSVSFYTIKTIKMLEGKTKIYLFYHGILESLGSKYKFYNMLFWFRKALHHMDKKIVNIVLGDCIRNNLIKEFPKLKNNTYAVDLVYPDSNNQPRDLNEKIEFAGVGFGHKEKNSDIIFELSDYYSKLAKFTHIGKMDLNLIPDKTDVNILGKNEPLPTNDFDEAIKKCDYGLLFYDESKYKFTASGAIFDILTQHKPIICLKNTYFSYVFNKMGDIGYLCKDKNELFSIVNKIIKEHDNSRYLQQQNNIIKNIYKFSENEYEKQLRFIFN